MLLNMTSTGDVLLASLFGREGTISGASRRELAIDGTRWCTRQLVRELMFDRHVVDGGSHSWDAAPLAIVRVGSF